MSIFDTTMRFVENVVAPIAGKISAQKHVIAVKDGFVATMPFLIVGSLLLVLAFPPSDSGFFFEGWHSLINSIGQDNILALSTSVWVSLRSMPHLGLDLAWRNHTSYDR